MTEIYIIKATFTEPLLGTVSKDPQVYASYIASKAPDVEQVLDEELASVPKPADAEDRGWTGFHEQDGKPFLYDYAVKGFLKDAASMLNRIKSTRTSKLTAFKKCIDGLVFVKPRKIEIHLSGPLEIKERPLRAQTAQGERIALARSDVAPAGSSIEFELHVLGVIKEPLLREWLDYAAYRGMGQWRNAGWGAFEYELKSA